MSGAEIAEAAVVLPILFMFLLSIYWFGRAYMVYGAINHAAREGARTAAVPAGCANCGVATTWSGTSLPDDTVVVPVVHNALLAAHLDPNQAVASVPSPAPTPCATPPGVCAPAQNGNFVICRNVQLNQGASSPPVCGEIVSFQYPYQFVVPFLSISNQRILLKAQVEMRSED